MHRPDHIKVTKILSIQLEKGSSTYIGNLHLTANLLIFGHPEVEIWVPYPIIHSVEKGLPTVSNTWPLHIRCYDFAFITFNFQSEKDVTDVYDIIQKLTCVSSVEQLYAFSFVPIPPFTTKDGWQIYNPIPEYQRMGVGSENSQWRFSDINQSFSFSPTYPHHIVVPGNISDAVLTHAAKHRSKARIPALSYLHWNKASITRSSQPMVGLKQNRSIQDEKLIESIFATNTPPSPTGHQVYGSTSTNLIIDARPTANAMVNTAVGAGTENMENYKNCKKVYSGIDNIHVMRDSLNKLVEALQEHDAKGMISKAALQRSGWLKHIGAIMEGGLMIVKNIHISSSHVLVHCSDGWDRTAQLTSLAQVCLDPHYRTMRGFQVLVEKEWCSFGYKFMDRCGHLSNDRNFVALSATNAAANTFANVQNKLYNNKHIRETSPVFQQFLDCVFQIMHQNPGRFEFNEFFLTQLHYHVYSCQFGNFLFNCERERRHYRAATSCHSVWDFFNSEKKLYLNTDYDADVDRARGGDGGVLFPDSKNIKYWAKLFGKTDAELNAPDDTTSSNSFNERATPESQGPGTINTESIASFDTESAVQQHEDNDPLNASSTPVMARPRSIVRTNNARRSVPSSPGLPSDADDSWPRGADNLAAKLPVAFSNAFGGGLMDSFSRLTMNVRDSWYASTAGPGSSSTGSFSDDVSQFKEVRSSSAGPHHRSTTVGRSSSHRQRPVVDRELMSISGMPLTNLTLEHEINRNYPYLSQERGAPKSPPNGSPSLSALSSLPPAGPDAKVNNHPIYSDSPLYDETERSTTPRVPSPDLTTELPASRSLDLDVSQEPELPHPLYVG
ncbi:hypothetical protein BGZ65_012525 [Modicella reniformis]|uniref:Myotubularin phosphatase domain-containing protein n=1 Tax=Modicella reniformis TaxID=1440133 RepID=A0A9P6J8S3_9FUNG|nr:hypothetical protein BGZ65_012525 [Modicella reniformis]